MPTIEGLREPAELWVLFYNRMVKGGFIEMVTFEQRCE